MRSNYYIEKYEEECKEVIQYIIEYLVYGDKNEAGFFE